MDLSDYDVFSASALLFSMFVCVVCVSKWLREINLIEHDEEDQKVGEMSDINCIYDDFRYCDTQRTYF